MRELIEVRIDESLASMLFEPDKGVRVGASVRMVLLDSRSAKLEQVGRLQRDLRHSIGKPFFYGWRITRKYAPRELDAAELLQLKATSVIGSAGEEFGTKYDEAVACPFCGAGARQVGPLVLEEKALPKGKDFARTIAGELVVSDRFAKALQAHSITGVKLNPVRLHKARSLEPSGWWQLNASETIADIVSPTRVGVDPFDTDPKSACCAGGDTVGLNLLSEVTVTMRSQGTADVIASRQFVGARRGLLRPERVIMISPGLYRLINAERVSGCEIEAVHVVECSEGAASTSLRSASLR